MKNIKRMFGIAILMAVIGSFCVGCALSNNQEANYNHFLTGLQERASGQEIKANEVKGIVERTNERFEIWGIKVTDKEPSKDIAKETKATALKKKIPVSKI